MKKIYILFAALFTIMAFVMTSCQKDFQEEYAPEPLAQEVTFNFNVAGLDDSSDTKAMKSGWSVGDVINIWFEGSTIFTQEDGSCLPDLSLQYNGNGWDCGTLTRTVNFAGDSGFVAVYESNNDMSKYLANHPYENSVRYSFPTVKNECTNGRYATQMGFVASQGYTKYTYDEASKTLSASISLKPLLGSFKITIENDNGMMGKDAGDYYLTILDKCYSANNAENILGWSIVNSPESSSPLYINFVAVDNDDINHPSIVRGVSENGAVTFYFSSFSCNDATLRFVLRESGSSVGKIYEVSNKTVSSSRIKGAVLKYSSFGAAPTAPETDAIEAVNLGLSVDWGTLNIGADYVTDLGDTYAWGMLTPSSEGRDYFDADYSKYCTFGDILSPSDDIATKTLGSEWRMPTKSEWEELVNQCDLSVEVGTDWDGFKVAACKFTSKSNGNSISIPIEIFGSSTWSINYWTSCISDISNQWVRKEYAKYMSLQYYSGVDQNRVSFYDMSRLNPGFIRPVHTKSQGDTDTPNPLTFTSSGSTTVALGANQYVSSESIQSVSLEYRLNGGSWAQYTLGDEVQLSDGQTLSFRAGSSGNTSFYGNQFITGGDGKLAVSGNIMSLLDATCQSTTISAAGCFYQLFTGSAITSAPELPATTLASSCYRDMFRNCESLTKAPDLPATALADYCYYNMFNNCESLTTAPALPATTLAKGCYAYMFYFCESLTAAPALPSTTLADYCYCGMFYSCNSITSAPALPATTLKSNCYSAMFSGCTSLTAAPALPATTLASKCYNEMFSRCSSITAAPALPATTLADNCYYNMFSNCTSLTAAPALPAIALAENCYYRMFTSCKSLTAAPDLPATTLAAYCYNRMFWGCTSLTAAPALPATVLADYCYQYMFTACTSLTAAPALPATTLADNCYNNLFSGCTSLATAPDLPATTLAKSCYSCMFSGCTSLTSAPALPATELTENCYAYMFDYCPILTSAPDLPAATLANNCYINMFTDCSNLKYVKAFFTEVPDDTWLKSWLENTAAEGKFVKNPSATWTSEEAQIPSGWTIVNAE